MPVVIELTRFLNTAPTWNVAPGVYAFYPNQNLQRASFWTNTFGVPFTQSDKQHVINDFIREVGERYDRQLSYQECADTEGSWFWDNEAQILYFHSELAYAPYTAEYSYGDSTGYVKGGDVTYIDDIEYLPILLGVPGIKQQQDLFNYPKLSYFAGSFTLSNYYDRRLVEGMLDFLLTENVYGNTIAMYTIPTQATYTRSDMTQVGSFFVEDYDIGLRETVIRAKDKRDNQETSVPTDTFTVADYPNISEDFANTVIPLCFGTIREQTAICTNGDAGSGAATFRQALTLTSLGTVYTKQNDVWVAVTPSSTNVATGEFTLAEADGRDAEGEPFECRVDGSVGIANTYAPDVIQYLNENYAQIAFNASNYDLTEWNAEKVSLSPIGLVLDQETPLSEVIAMIQGGANVGFRYEINGLGLRTIRIDDEDRSVSAYISNVEIQNRETMPSTTDRKNLIAEARVQYAKSYNSGKYLSIKDSSVADTVFKTYRFRPYKEFPTLLVDSTAAQARADFEIERNSTIRPIVKIEAMGDAFTSLRIFDIVDIELTPSDFVDRDTGTILGRRFRGIKKCKVIGVDPNFESRVNSIQAVIIGDA